MKGKSKKNKLPIKSKKQQKKISIRSKKKKIVKHHIKASKITAQERVEFIKSLRLAEYTYPEIIKINKVKRWQVKEDQIYAYISHADKQITEYKKSDFPKWIRECEQRLKQLYLNNYLLKDFSECRRVLDTANKILGFERLKIEIDKTETTNINIHITKEMQEPQRIEDVITEMMDNKLIPESVLAKIGEQKN